jgi:hypothetical protein
MLTIERVVKNEEKITFLHNMIVENNDFTDKVVLDLSRSGGLCTMFAFKGKKNNVERKIIHLH